MAVLASLLSGCAAFERAAIRASSVSLTENEQACLECSIKRPSQSPSATHAVAFLREGCNDDDGRSCSVLGGAYEVGRGVKANAKESKRLYAQACKLENAKGCSNLGRVLAGEKDHDGAAWAWQLACQYDDGSMKGCAELKQWASRRRGQSAAASTASVFQ